MEDLILVAYSEIGLKGTITRKRFEGILVENIRKLGANFKVRMKHNKILLEPASEKDMELLIEHLRFVFGIEYYARARWVKYTSLEELGKIVAKMYAQQIAGKTFRITAKRSGKHNFTSVDVQRVVGEHVCKAGGKVDLKHYCVEIVVDVREDGAYIYDSIVRGPGGLPLGSEGKVVVLFSGGIDSPVAAWIVMKRGCMSAFLYVNLGGEETLANVYRVYTKLTDRWCRGRDLGFYVVDGKGIVDAIKRSVAPSYRQVVLKKAFYVLAERLCKEIRADAIVTGESIGQVSTQTLKNLAAIEGDSRALFVRPLIGFDKEETIRIAEKIGTYNASMCVGELCNISSGSVKTAALEREVVREYEKIRGVVEGANVTMVTIVPKPAETIPQLHETIDLDREKIDLDKLDKTKFYVIMCKEGTMASRECEMLRQLGYKCVGVKKGKHSNKEL